MNKSPRRSYRHIKDTSGAEEAPKEESVSSFRMWLWIGFIVGSLSIGSYAMKSRIDAQNARIVALEQQIKEEKESKRPINMKDFIVRNNQAIIDKYTRE